MCCSSASHLVCVVSTPSSPYKNWWTQPSPSRTVLSYPTCTNKNNGQVVTPHGLRSKVGNAEILVESNYIIAPSDSQHDWLSTRNCTRGQENIRASQAHDKTLSFPIGDTTSKIGRMSFPTYACGRSSHVSTGKAVSDTLPHRSDPETPKLALIVSLVVFRTWRISTTPHPLRPRKSRKLRPGLVSNTSNIALGDKTRAH